MTAARLHLFLAMVAVMLSAACLKAAPVDTLPIDTLPTDTLPAGTTPVDTMNAPATSADAPSDSTTKPKPDSSKIFVPPSPPVRLLDSLSAYFALFAEKFDVRARDLYPRNAAEFVSRNASYFVVPYHETPLRTTVAPFGLPGSQIGVVSGTQTLRPYDRVIPADGKMDFDDIASGDVEAAAIVEGPLAAVSGDGALSLMHLQPMAIPDDKARSEFTMERGNYGYAYTRARLARMFSRRVGLTLSTDYRKGVGRTVSSSTETPVGFDAADDSYNITTRLLYHLNQKTTAEFSLRSYRRNGNFPYKPEFGGYLFRRLRRDHVLAATITRHDIFGGQLTGRGEYQQSRSAYSGDYRLTDFYRTITPAFYRGELALLLPRDGRLLEFTLTAGKDKYTINQVSGTRNYIQTGVSGLLDARGGKIFFFGRWRAANEDKFIAEGAAGYAADVAAKWKMQASLGYVGRWPDLVDRIAPERIGAVGAGELINGLLAERGNPYLGSERKLAANLSLKYLASHALVTLAVNGGTIHDLIYYDRRYDAYPEGEVFPANDRVNFADINVSAAIDTLGPFFVAASATARTVNSDRYGSRSPYSPRWQVYGQAGLRYYLAKYQIHIRLYGDLSYTERPLSYEMKKLSTAAMATGGINLSLKDLTFYYIVRNSFNQYHRLPEGYGYYSWFNSWGFNWKFID